MPVSASTSIPHHRPQLCDQWFLRRLHPRGRRLPRPHAREVQQAMDDVTEKLSQNRLAILRCLAEDELAAAQADPDSHPMVAKVRKFAAEAHGAEEGAHLAPLFLCSREATPFTKQVPEKAACLSSSNSGNNVHDAPSDFIWGD
jgi:hypothetical protein